ncbi:MAG TPA: DoxX family protein [Xanthobacteraceae bacterium]|nr:DoxX family protein [Xanthobacteraceae bacterium]
MAEIAPRPAAGSRSIVVRFFAKLTAVCAVIPYALVGLALRLIMARVFFLSGQAKIEGPVIPINTHIRDLEFSVILPADIKESTLRMFETQYSGLPLPPTVAAYLFTYAEFVLPICLLLGFATRLSALALLVMTVLLQVYVMPAMLWPTHVYWAAILLVLMTVGPGAISLDALIRAVYRRGGA